MIRVRCPTGCPGSVPRPFRLRDEPIRCANCTAWFRIDGRVEDGALVTGELLARPGERLPDRPRRRRGGGSALLHLAAASLLVAGLVESPLGGGPILLCAAVACAWAAGRKSDPARR